MDGVRDRLDAFFRYQAQRSDSFIGYLKWRKPAASGNRTDYGNQAETK